MEKLELIGKRLFLEPSKSEIREGGIFIPSNVANATSMCRVVRRGSTVSPFIKEGSIVMCQNGFAERKEDLIKGGFFCLENNIYSILLNGIIFPIGNKILIRRDISDAYVNGILIPENRRFQSLTGTIVRFGLTRNPYKTVGLNLGARVRLVEWAEHMIGMTLEDGHYGLIVNEKDLLYIEMEEES